ncbi:hypothetical protein F5X99DRAFT_387068 [Biscogniauxia marginata]|nr:hypothetical protein F5X99DRAFT_387068 [Biscogniauxia marginata]
MEQQPPEQIQSELENFREQWRAEVSARTRSTANPPQQQTNRQSHQTDHSSSSYKPPKKNEPSHRRTTSKNVAQLVDDDEEYVPTQSFDEPDANRTRGGQGLDGEDATSSKDSEPKTALEFYEHAVERETTGKLGDSLQLYRKAFRMDNRVDISYRDKHFPGRWKPAAQQQNPSGASATVPNTAHHSLEGGGEEVISLSLPELITSFAGLKIEGVVPECEGMPAPPCPIAALPDEVLVHILRDVAIADVGDFMRLAQVCKRLAYLVATEDQIWRRVCVGPEFGFAGMHHHWQCGIGWEPLDTAEVLAELSDADDEATGADEIFTLSQLAQRRAVSSLATTNALLHSSPYNSSWQRMFRRRPRVRFNGCYISTVNYIRAGQHGGNQSTWGNPIHIVTYYRYLRFFRDGSAVSLLTTEEPAHVVHHMTKENVALHHRDAGTGASHHLPSSVMSSALRGRWRLSSPLDSNGNDDKIKDKDDKINVNSLADAEGDLYVETEGVGKYMYRMELSFRSAGRAAARNNKLAWKGFWSYNRLTDDWAEFALKNDKPFFFSRVRSYGLGG